MLYWDNPTGDAFVAEKRVLGDSIFNIPLLVNQAGNGLTDSLFVQGVSYEYRVKSISNPLHQGYYVYVKKGMGNEFRGTVLILKSSTIGNIPSYENYFLKDLEGDGFFPIESIVDPAWTPVDVRNEIISRKNDFPDLKHVIILGNVPKPLSGFMYPDGHIDHRGAWPADVFYADITGNYTDSTLNFPVAYRSNVANDGRWDQSLIPDPDSLVELAVGRIDFYGETSFGLSEDGLYDFYFRKNHRYRDKIYNISNRAIISDQFGFFSGELFATSGWRSFLPSLGHDSISTTQTLFTTSPGNNYKYFYGCGGGTFVSCGAVGSIGDYQTTPAFTVFNMMFGSYFGDYYDPGGLLNAPLLNLGFGLTNCWSGRPLIYLHQMCGGATIGECFMTSQNNSGSSYISNYGGKFTHTALLGDPTLSSEVLAPVRQLNISLNGGVLLTWRSSLLPVDGFRVYRKMPGEHQYSPIATGSGVDTFFVDQTLPNPGTTYMVRSFAYTDNPCGSYMNFSNGQMVTMDSSLFVTGKKMIAPGKSSRVFPNPANGFCFVEALDSDPGDVLSVAVSSASCAHLFTRKLHSFESFDLSGLDAGIYFLTVHFPDGESKRHKISVTQ